MRDAHRFGGIWLSGATGAVLAISGAQAQAAISATGEPPIADIVVTAQKRAERLQEVPASVSVVTAADLGRQGSVRFEDYAAQIPGLSLTSVRTGNTQVTLRGITTGASQPGSTTGFYVDEAPVGSVNAYTGGNMITPDLDPSDIGQIEVLKGPQGTLYGAGAVGGLLKFTTVPTDLSQFQARASAGITGADHGDLGYSGRAMVNLPLAADRLGLHVSGFYRRDPGTIVNIDGRIGRDAVDAARVRGGRAVLSTRFSPGLRLDVSAILQDIGTDGTDTEDVDAATLKPLYGDLRQRRFLREDGDERLRLYNATWHADLGDVSLVSSTTYQRIFYRELSDGTRGYGALFGPLTLHPDLGVAIDTIKHSARWSEEVRASRNGLFAGWLDLQAGAYWTHESDRNRIPGIDTFSTTSGAAISPLRIGLPPAVLRLLGLPASLSGATSTDGIVTARIDSSYDEYSGFANARLHLDKVFYILGGVRFSHDHQTYAQDYRGLLILVSTGGASARLAADGVETHDVTTWMITPRIRMSDDAMLYGRVATGYRPGGPNPAPPSSVASVPSTFRPDRLIQYELGFKGRTPNQRVTVDAALFHTDWRDVQIQTSGGGFNYLVNGGAARSQGGELSLGYRPTRAFSVAANLAYTDARLASAAPAVGGLKGDRLPYVPRWAGSLIADDAVPLGDGTTLHVGATARYVGRRESDFPGRFGKRLGAYAMVDLRAGIEHGRYALSAFARNLGDRRAFLVVQQEGLRPSDRPGAIYAASVVQPRRIGMEASVHF